MIRTGYYIHTLQDNTIDLQAAVCMHSADELVTYKNVDGQDLRFGLFYPKCVETELRPAILMIHGGGWQSRKEFTDQKSWSGDYLGFLARYFANQGYVCASIDYRLAQNNGQAEGYQLIDLFDDCLEAANYIYSNAQRYGIDRNRMIVLGESAGGQLAGALATFPSAHHLNLRGAILVNPIMDFVYDKHWQTYIPQKSEHPMLKSLSFEQRCIYLSPLWRIGKETCPIILLHGKDDSIVSADHSLRAYEAMNEVHVPCQLHIFENTNHAFLLAEFTDNQTACKLGVEVISNVITEILSSDQHLS